MKTKKFLSSVFAVTAASLAFVACSSNDDATDETVDNNLIRIEAIHPSQVTRVNDTGFDSGDSIGVYVVSDSTTLQPGGNELNNALFSYSGSAWTSVRNYYWNEGTHDVYAYYPYQGTIDDTEEFVFELPADQSTDTGYSSADFLWAKAESQTASASPVKLSFSHVLSKVVVELVKSDDYEGDLPTDMEVYIHSLETTAAIDLSTGSSSVNTSSTMNSVKAKKLSDTEFTAIVVPQRISSRRPLVEVVSGNVSYMMEGTISIKQGYQHTITVTLSKSPEQAEIEIGGGIGSWD